VLQTGELQEMHHFQAILAATTMAKTRSNSAIKVTRDGYYLLSFPTPGQLSLTWLDIICIFLPCCIISLCIWLSRA
jgi:hypothetical protein